VNDVTAESADSKPVSATTREVPPVMEQIRATAREPRRVPLAWARSKDEKVIGYEVWRAKGDEDFVMVEKVAGGFRTNYIDHGGAIQSPADIALLADERNNHINS
jgi:hypothetical protein